MAAARVSQKSTQVPVEMQLSSPAEQVQRSDRDAMLQMRAPADVQSLSDAQVPAARAAEGETQQRQANHR